MKAILMMLLTVISLSALAQDATVVQIEYSFDADYGIGNNTIINVTPAADGTFPFTASMAGLSVGYHKLYIRTKDSNGKWSFTTRRNFEVFTPLPKTNIISGEYFIDADPGYDAGMPINIVTPDSVILQNLTAATSGLTLGYHKLYGRLKDNMGRWSHTFRRNIEVYKNDTNYVYKVEYFFKTDNGYGNCTEVTFASPSVDGNLTFTIPSSQIPGGADTTLFIRVQDSTEGKWSLTALKDSARVLPLTLLSFTVAKQNSTAQLNWQTANEINTTYFNVQRSTDGRSFTTIGKVNAGSIDNKYAFTDNITGLPKGNAYYRLQITDKDGSISYSNIKSVAISGLFTVAILPNPVVGSQATLSIYSPANARLQMMIYNQTGIALFTKEWTVPGGNTTHSINLSGFAAGSYWVRVTDGVSAQIIHFIKL